MTSPTHFLNQVLSEIEAGHTGEALLMLSGMLDGAVTNDGDLTLWRQSLKGHPIHKIVLDMLASLHVIKNSECVDRQLLGAPQLIGPAGSKAITEIVSKLGFVRAMAARRLLLQQTIGEVWRIGGRIALSEQDRIDALDGLGGLDMQNVHFLSQELHLCTSCTSVDGDIPQHDKPCPGQFDLILASNLADHLEQNALARICAGFAERLKYDGRIVLSAFAPGHLGQGLHQLCVNPDLVCHTEETLQQTACVAGLIITSFRDASDSLIWAEMRHEPNNRHSTGRPI